MSACAGSSHSFCHLLCLEFILHIHFVFCHQGKDQRGTRKHRVKKPEEEREGERREREKLTCKAETVQAGNTEFTPPGLRMHSLGTASMKESLILCNFNILRMCTVINHEYSSTAFSVSCTFIWLLTDGIWSRTGLSHHNKVVAGVGPQP